MRCGYCFARSAVEGPCGVCGIDPAKGRAALTPAEKKKADRCRTLYTVGFLSIVGGGVGLFSLIPSFFFYLRGSINANLATRTAYLPYYVTAMAVVNLCLPVFGLAVRRYKKASYAGGIAVYSLYILASLPLFHVGPVLVAALFLYWIASPPSREILVR